MNKADNRSLLRLESLVAHRDIMLLLDEVLETGPDHAVARVVISPESAFFIEPQGVPAWIGIEYMAQCVAVLGGAREQAKGLPPPVGYLLGTRAFDTRTDWFTSGQVLDIFCREELFDDNGLGAYNCRIECDHLLAESRLTVFKKSP